MGKQPLQALGLMSHPDGWMTLVMLTSLSFNVFSCHHTSQDGSTGLSDRMYAEHIVGVQQLVSHLLFLHLLPLLLACDSPISFTIIIFKPKFKNIYL